MSFPADPLDIRIRIALDADRSVDWTTWDWEEISVYGREADQIVIGQGDADEFGETPPATCALTLDNRDGRFSRRNPSGPYYGRFGRNTPIWIEVDPGTGYETRFVGEVADWPKRWDPSATDSTVSISCGGVSRRLGQNDATAQAALTGYLGSTDPIAWWPFDDGADSTQARSGLPDGAPMLVRRDEMDFVPDEPDLPPGISGCAHPQPTGANQMVGPISDASSTGFQVSVWTKGVVTTEGTDAYYIPWEVRTTTGQIFRLLMQYEVDTAIGVGRYTSEDQEVASNFLELDDSGSPHLNPGITGRWINVQFLASQNGANIDVWLYVDNVLVDSATWNSVTLGAPRQVNAIGRFAGTLTTISLNMADIYLAQLAVHDWANWRVPQYDQGYGFVGEQAGDRIERLLTEAGIPIEILGSADTEPMGAQGPGTVMALARESESTDGGTLQDHPTEPGMLYIPRAERYNLTPWELDYDDGDVGGPPEAADDDQRKANRVTATRPGGTTAVAQDDEDIAATGIVVDDPISPNVWHDDQLQHQAGWRLNLDQVDEDRWPKIPLNFARRPELIPNWLTVVPGATRAQIANMPAQAGPDPVDVIIEGWTETISQFQWTVDLFCSPASPWTVGVIEDPVLGRPDTAGSKLAAAFDAGTDTSALVVTTSGPAWITTAGQSAMFPVNVRSGGVVLEVTGIADAVGDTFSRTVSNGLGTATTGQVYSIDGGLASSYSVVGGTTGRIATTTAGTLYIGHIDAGSPDAAPRYRFTNPVLPTGAAFTHRVAARMTDTSNYYEAQVTIATTGVVTLQVFKRVAGTGSAVGSSVVIPGTHSAGNSWWVQIWPVGDIIRARAWKSTDAEPRGWHITTTDTSLTTGTRVGILVRRETSNSNGSTNIDFDDLTVPNLQTFTFTQAPVNGVTRTIPADTALSLADPWRAAL